MPAEFAPAKQMSFEEGYMGPGATNHVYQFRLYALKTATFSANGNQEAYYDKLEADPDDVVLEVSTLRGKSPS
jgi:phosphatidylethanolamine-binding protein (PEBP) family uncharacterized protein